jgi:hydrogenase-4 component F
MPPLGLFMSEFLVVSSTFAARAAARRCRWCSACWSVRRADACGLGQVAFGEPRGPSAPAQASFVPMYAHLALVFSAGIYLPPPLVALVPECRKGCSDEPARRHRASAPSRGASALAAHHRG